MRFSLAISMCDPSHYLPLARAAEAAGWDSVCVPDGGPWTEQTSEAYGTGGQRWWGPDTAFLEPFVVIPAMAAVTEHFAQMAGELSGAPLVTLLDVDPLREVIWQRIGRGVAGRRTRRRGLRRVSWEISS